MITIGQVGLGRWGPNVLRNFVRLPGSWVKVCCDQDPQALAQTQAQYPGLQTTQDFDQLLVDPDLDAIVVTSSARSHFPLARAALERQKHVFVEKPLSLKVVEGQELVSLARTQGLTLMVGHLLLYHPAVQRLRAYIEQGELGSVRYIYSQRLNLGQVRRDENALWSLAPHDISVALYLLGKQPTSVSAQGRDFLRPGVHDLVFLTMEFADDSLAHCHVSWLDPHKVRRLTVVGSQKMAVFDDTVENKLLLYPHRVDWAGRAPRAVKAEAISVELRKAEPLKEECRHFLDCVASRQTPSNGYRAHTPDTARTPGKYKLHGLTYPNKISYARIRLW